MGRRSGPKVSPPPVSAGSGTIVGEKDLINAKILAVSATMLYPGASIDSCNRGAPSEKKPAEAGQTSLSKLVIEQ